MFRGIVYLEEVRRVHCTQASRVLQAISYRLVV
jgi:hypothetical protein